MVSLLLSLGAVGMLGVSVLCPCLAWTVYAWQRRHLRKQARPDQRESSIPSRIDIVIPAFNEAVSIGSTLAAVHASVKSLRAHFGDSAPETFVRVAADGCTDETGNIARRYPPVTVLESQVNKSKWVTLTSILATSTADWIIFVDAGALWPETLLTDIVKRIGEEPRAFAVAPAYRPSRGGWFTRALWRLETSLKTAETMCGGPISVHGATVAYKTSAAQEALIMLGDRPWLNDDVVLPLVLRSLLPDGRILYPVGEISDVGATHDRLDIGRRRRMLLGNIQWVRFLLAGVFERNPVAGLLASRRLFRVLWAYWIAFVLLGLALAFRSAVAPVVALSAAAWVVSGHVRQIGGAALVSLLTPLLILRSNGPLQAVWE